MKEALLFFLVLLYSFTILAQGDAPPTPTETFLKLIRERQENFKAIRKRIYDESLCPGPDTECILKTLEGIPLRTSGDIDNGVSLLAWAARRKFKKGECQEICRMNITAEYSVAVARFLKGFSRQKLAVNELPMDVPETKYLRINEELRIYRELIQLRRKLSDHEKKIDPTRLFRPELVKHVRELPQLIEEIAPSVLLRGAYLSSLRPDDEALLRSIQKSAATEEKRVSRRDLIKQFRAEVKN